MMRAAASLFRETLRWAWTRDEIHQSSTQRKILYHVVLYGSWFVIMIGGGIVLQLVGYTDAGGGIWFFGIWFSTFIASIDIAWETLTYLLERRDERRDSTGSNETTRELARDLRPARDSWVGFVVTIVALVMLILAWQVALAFTGFSF